MTRVVKLYNLVDDKHAKNFLRPRFETLLKDISAEVSKIVSFTRAHVVTTKNACTGAECGTLFFELETKEDSEKLIETLHGQSYESNLIKSCCVPEEAYVEYYLKQFDKGAF